MRAAAAYCAAPRLQLQVAARLRSARATEHELALLYVGCMEYGMYLCSICQCAASVCEARSINAAMPARDARGRQEARDQGEHLVARGRGGRRASRVSLMQQVILYCQLSRGSSAACAVE